MPSHPLHRGTRLNRSLAHCEKVRGRAHERMANRYTRQTGKDEQDYPKERQRAIADSATFPLLRFAFFRISTYN